MKNWAISVMIGLPMVCAGAILATCAHDWIVCTACAVCGAASGIGLYLFEQEITQ